MESTSLQWRKIERSQNAVEQVAIKVNTPLNHARICLTQIRDKAPTVTRFENGDAALDLHALLLRKLAGAQIIEEDEVRSEFSTRIAALSSPRPSKAARSRSPPGPPDMLVSTDLDPRTFSRPHASAGGVVSSSRDNLGVDRSQWDDQCAIEFFEQVKRVDLGEGD